VSVLKILARDRRRFNPIALTNIHISSPLRKAARQLAGDRCIGGCCKSRSRVTMKKLVCDESSPRFVDCRSTAAPFDFTGFASLLVDTRSFSGGVISRIERLRIRSSSADRASQSFPRRDEAALRCTDNIFAPASVANAREKYLSFDAEPSASLRR